jgi:hypothetical protein
VSPYKPDSTRGPVKVTDTSVHNQYGGLKLIEYPGLLVVLVVLVVVALTVNWDEAESIEGVPVTFTI